MKKQLIVAVPGKSERERKSRLLNILIYCLTGLLGVIIIIAITLRTAQMVSTIIAALAVFAVCVLSYWLNRKGWFVLATYIFLGGSIIIANVLVIMPDVAVETRGICPFFYTIAVVAGGMLIYPLASFWLATFGAVILGIVVTLGGGPALFSLSGDLALGWGIMLVPIIFSYLFAAISWLFSSSMDRAFLALQTVNEKLQASEEELRASNDELQTSEEELRAANEELLTANEELRETQEQLVRSEKLAAIGQLAGGVGHELRNPLGAIKNAVYYVKGKVAKSELGQKEPRVMEFLNIIDDEINSSNKIINDLLGFSRLGKPAVSPTRIDKVIEDALSHVTIPESIELVKKLDADLPEVEVDPDQIRQVLVNLATNAVQAMPEGGKLTIAAGQRDDLPEIKVTDTGYGIPKQNLNKIFDPLFTTKAKGIGLGLAVCRSIIDRHEGDIKVKSKAGEGTTFTIKLPVKAA